MAWIVLFAAGFLETGWALGLKRFAEHPSLTLIVSIIAMMGASMAGLTFSMKYLPLGVAYPIWTGIGATGSVIIGAVLMKETVGLSTIIGVLFLCAGMVLIGGKPH